MATRFYIDGPEDDGEGIYVLVAETGEMLASHYCSHWSFSKHDLVTRRTALQQEWRARFGEFEVVRLGQDEMTADELQRRNRVFVGEVVTP